MDVSRSTLDLHNLIISTSLFLTLSTSTSSDILWHKIQQKIKTLKQLLLKMVVKKLSKARQDLEGGAVCLFQVWSQDLTLS